MFRPALSSWSRSLRQRSSRTLGRRALRAEALDDRRMLAFTVDIGDHLLLPDTANQRIPIMISSDDPENDPLIGGMTFRMSIGDGDEGDSTPKFTAIDYTGSLWETFPRDVGSVNGPIGATDELVEGNVIFSRTEDVVAMDGILATVVISTEGFNFGSFDLTFTGSPLTRETELLEPVPGGSPITHAVDHVTNGSIQLGGWQNPVNPLDVDDNGSVFPLDALIVINFLNAEGVMMLDPPTEDFHPAPFYDTNGDNQVAPIDVLLIINELNRQTQGEGEEDLGSLGPITDQTPVTSQVATSSQTVVDASPASEPLLASQYSIRHHRQRSNRSHDLLPPKRTRRSTLATSKTFWKISLPMWPNGLADDRISTTC